MIIDGKKIQQEIEETLRILIEQKKYVLDILYIGDNPVIETYIRAKKRFGERLGISVRVHHLAKESSASLVQEKIKELEIDSSGMILQLPLPEHLDTKTVVNYIKPSLDIDILSENTYHSFLENKNRRYPPVLRAMLYALDAYDISLLGKKICVLGNGRLVGKPIADYLRMHSIPFVQMTKTNFSPNPVQEADIIFSGMGVAHMLTSDLVKEGVIVFDAGTSEEGSTVLGDVEPSVMQKALYMTPVPGGIGPLTVTALFHNLITPYEL